MKWVDNLFDRMKSSYGSRFLEMWVGIDLDKVKPVWGQQMALLTDQELKRGAAGMMARDWPPTLPEFIKLCRPSIDPEMAYLEAVEQGKRRDDGYNNYWSSLAIFWAWRSIGSHDMKALSWPAIKPRWIKALSDQMAKGEWEPIPETISRVAIATKAGRYNEHGQTELNKLLGLLVVKDLNIRINHKAWAYRVMERLATGDTSVCSYSEQQARLVLGLPPMREK